jgi:hypothetical protein
MEREEVGDEVHRRRNVTVTGPFDDLPLIRCKPVPTDDELAAEREAKYQAQLAKEAAGEACSCSMIYCDCCWPLGEVTA